MKPIVEPLRKILANTEIPAAAEVTKEVAEKEEEKLVEDDGGSTPVEKEVGEVEDEEEDDDDEFASPDDLDWATESYGPMGQEYIAALFRSNDGSIEPKYAPICDQDEWKLGTASFLITEKDEIVVGDKRYPASRGLFELIFKKVPKDFSDEDRGHYKEILETSRVHLSAKTGRPLPQHAATSKWKRVIRPPLDNTQIGGGGVRYRPYSAELFDYSHWHDPNALAHRLQVLVGERDAVNRSVEFEITTLINIMVQRGIIYQGNDWRFMSVKK